LRLICEFSVVSDLVRAPQNLLASVQTKTSRAIRSVPALRGQREYVRSAMASTKQSTHLPPAISRLFLYISGYPSYAFTT
jgi:hypothetical protein